MDCLSIHLVTVATGAVTLLAGNFDHSTGLTDGTGTNARFTYPVDVHYSNDGTMIYVADCNNHAIRQIVVSTAVVTTLAGSGAGHADGPGSSAKFSSPNGCACSPDGMQFGNGTLF